MSGKVVAAVNGILSYVWWYLVGLRIVMKIVYGGKLNASLYLGQ